MTVFHAPLLELKTPEKKTLAMLDRGAPYPNLFAISGWQGGDEAINEIIDNNFWTHEVLKIAKLLPHDFPSAGRDVQGRKGYFFSCHAEEQLIAVVIRKHRMAEDEDDDPELIPLGPPPV